MNSSLEQYKSTNTAIFPLQTPTRDGEICGSKRQEEKNDNCHHCAPEIG